ncbi:MAG: ABC transporter permease [Oscillospiraceae bacterium]|nr:ABC transporter permease [Oscillospiraceae bacterium]
MWRYSLKRLLQLIPILLGITLLSFALMQTASGDTVDMLIQKQGMTVTPEAQEAMRHEMGLDQPFIVQYFQWLGKILTGDMGYSYVKNTEVFPLFMKALPNTLLLTLTSIVTTICISIPLGVVSAVKQNKVTDYIIRFFSFIGNALPGFFVALLLLYIFALQLNWLPVMGNNGFQSIILPTLTLAIAMSAKYTRQVRATVLEELSKDYVVGCKARGIKGHVIILANVLKNSMLTIVTLLALSIGSLLGGTAITESIFMWPGVGKLAVDAIGNRDYQIIQVYVIWMAIIYVVINLITDLIYHFLDPRIRIKGEG